MAALSSRLVARLRFRSDVPLQRRATRQASRNRSRSSNSISRRLAGGHLRWRWASSRRRFRVWSMSLMCRVRRRGRSSSWTTLWGVLRLDTELRWLMVRFYWKAVGEVGMCMYVRFLTYEFCRVILAARREGMSVDRSWVRIHGGETRIFSG